MLHSVNELSPLAEPEPKPHVLTSGSNVIEFPVRQDRDAELSTTSFSRSRRPTTSRRAWSVSLTGFGGPPAPRGSSGGR